MGIALFCCKIQKWDSNWGLSERWQRLHQLLLDCPFKTEGCSELKSGIVLPASKKNGESKYS